jgi:hypothetical protein
MATAASACGSPGERIVTSMSRGGLYKRHADEISGHLNRKADPKLVEATASDARVSDEN